MVVMPSDFQQKLEEPSLQGVIGLPWALVPVCHTWNTFTRIIQGHLEVQTNPTGSFLWSEATALFKVPQDEPKYEFKYLVKETTFTTPSS